MLVYVYICLFVYVGTREIQMKTLNSYISLLIEYKRYTMTSLFYVVSSVCNTSVPAFRKCRDASINIFFLVESAATRAPPAGPLRRT